MSGVGLGRVTVILFPSGDPKEVHSGFTERRFFPGRLLVALCFSMTLFDPKFAVVTSRSPERGDFQGSTDQAEKVLKKLFFPGESGWLSPFYVCLQLRS